MREQRVCCRKSQKVRSIKFQSKVISDTKSSIPGRILTKIDKNSLRKRHLNLFIKDTKYRNVFIDFKLLHKF